MLESDLLHLRLDVPAWHAFMLHCLDAYVDGKLQINSGFTGHHQFQLHIFTPHWFGHLKQHNTKFINYKRLLYLSQSKISENIHFLLIIIIIIISTISAIVMG